MTPLNRETLTAIAGHSNWPSITFYLPTHRTFPEKEQDRIRLKNLLRDACDTLVAAGLGARGPWPPQTPKKPQKT